MAVEQSSLCVSGVLTVLKFAGIRSSGWPGSIVRRSHPPAWPSARLLFCWHFLIVYIETPAKRREGLQQNASLGDGCGLPAACSHASPEPTTCIDTIVLIDLHRRWGMRLVGAEVVCDSRMIKRGRRLSAKHPPANQDGLAI